MPVDWDDLKVFLVVSERGSIRQAADTLRVAHSTVSRRIEALEQGLSTRLFDRTPNGLLITAAGELLLTSARHVEETMHAAELAVAGRDLELSGDIRFTLPLIVATQVLADSLAEFVRDHPEVNLIIETTDDLLDLSKREADVAMRFVRTGETPPGYLVGRPLGMSAQCAYASQAYIESHVFSGEGRNATWLGWEDETAFPEWVYETSLEPMPAKGRYKDVHVQIALAKRGLGMSLLPCMLADPDPDLHRVPGARVMRHHQIWMLTHPDLRDTARVRHFREFMNEAILREADLIEGRTA